MLLLLLISSYCIANALYLRVQIYNHCDRTIAVHVPIASSALGNCVVQQNPEYTLLAMSVKSNKAIWSKFGSPSNNSAKLLLEPLNASPLIALDGRTVGAAHADNIAFEDYSFDAICASKSPSTSPSLAQRRARAGSSSITTAAAAVAVGPRKSTAMSLALEVCLQNKWYSA